MVRRTGEDLLFRVDLVFGGETDFFCGDVFSESREERRVDLFFGGETDFFRNDAFF